MDVVINFSYLAYAAYQVQWKMFLDYKKRKQIKTKQYDILLTIMGLIVQVQVVQKVYNAIHWVNHYLVDGLLCFVNTCALDSDLFGG